MEMTEIHRARANERMFERRAARTRRAKWLGRVVFSMTGMALTLTLYLNPNLASQLVEWTQGTDVPQALRTAEKPVDVYVRSMPSDVIPVRRGSTPFGN